MTVGFRKPQRSGCPGNYSLIEKPSTWKLTKLEDTDVVRALVEEDGKMTEEPIEITSGSFRHILHDMFGL